MTSVTKKGDKIIHSLPFDDLEEARVYNFYLHSLLEVSRIVMAFS